LRLSIHELILEPCVLTFEHRSPVIDLVPPTDGQTDGMAEPDDRAVSPGFRHVRAGQLGVDQLPLAEFAYNSVHVSTRLTSSFANYGHHPEMHFKQPKKGSRADSLPDPRFRSERAADERLKNLQEARARLWETIIEVQQR
jgi:hypothetical protein